MIFTSISPNTEIDDVLLALKTLCVPWTWRIGRYEGALEAAFQEQFSLTHAFAFQSGRNALYAMLKALDLKPGDEILLQAYTCVAVPEPILWTGAVPVYVDIDETLTMDTEDLKKKITPRSRVLIIQHTFGMPANLSGLLAIAREKELFVIEDCAHALGAQYAGRYVGTFGHASFFSFGRDKVLSSVFGGVLAVADDSLAEKVKSLRNSFRYPSYFSIARQLLHPVLMSIAKATYDTLSIGKILIILSRQLRLIPLAVEQPERQGGKPSFFGERMPNALARLALHQYAKLDRYNDQRHTLSGLYARELSGMKAQHVTEQARPLWLRYTLLIGNAGELIKTARRHGIELGDWYRQAIAPARVRYEKIGYQPGSCLRAETMAAQSVNLPTAIGVTEHDARTVINFIKRHAG